VDTDYTTQTGWLGLDFANTVDWHASTHPEDKLHGYADLVVWAEKAGIVTSPGAAKLAERGRQAPAEAEAVLVKAKELREAIYGILVAKAHGLGVPADDLATVNRAAVDLHARSRLVPKEGGFAWELETGGDKLDSLLWPVVRSALDLLTTDALERVGQCADADGCGWLFWDTSRNKSRRWCDMGDCGNRAKVRRYYSRKKQQS
jgi:predicted RNA-binding Zn ribbon-like protein